VVTGYPLTGDPQWIYGGAFSIGDGSAYNGSTFVQRSVELDEPVIYVNFNYRVNAFGWLAGKEALAGGAANVGLHDREYHPDDQQSFVTSDRQFLPIATWTLTVRGSAREVIPGLGWDLHFQVRWRSEQGYSVSFDLCGPPRHQLLIVLHAQCSWGQSAGALSITAHLATTPVDPPFKAVILVGLCDQKTRFDIANNPVKF